MDSLLTTRLLQRDQVESRFHELFIESKPTWESSQDNELSNDALMTTVTRLRKELKSKDDQVAGLKDVINVKNKDSEKLNDEIISLNIENNMLHKKFEDLEEEHNKLVKRWLDKVQKDVETLNANLS